MTATAAHTPARRGYRMALVEVDPDQPPTRIKVVRFQRQDGMEVRWTETCSGCTPSYEESGGATHECGSGCHECGYTGRRRRVEWVPLPKEIKKARSTKGSAAKAHQPTSTRP